MSRHRLNQNRGAGNRHQQAGHVQSGHGHPAHGNVSHQQVQHGIQIARRRFAVAGPATEIRAAAFPVPTLPPPNGQPPFRFDLSHLLHPEEVQKIDAGW